MSRNIDVIISPDRREPNQTKRTIFLAGPTTDTGEPNWRETLINALADQSVTVFDPTRTDWDGTWKEDRSDAKWVDQVNWELEKQEQADVVVLFFHQATLAPISLLELGLCVQSGRAIVCAVQDYKKRGNVELVCERYGATFVNKEEDLKNAMLERLRR